MQSTHQTAIADDFATASPATAGKGRFAFHWEYLAIFLVILLIAGIRFRLRDFPLERDEGEYAYAGQLVLQGIPPYQLAYNMKLPGTYAAYAVIMAVFGQTTAGIHLGVILVNSACILLVFFIARELFDSIAAVVAGAVFGLFAVRPHLLGLAGHATHFVTLAALASMYLLLKACGTNRFFLFFCSGAGSGLALLMKQPGVFFAIFAILYLCWREWPGSEPRFPFVRKLISFSAGAILPYAITCLILLRAGIFQKFWFWTVSYARAYGSKVALLDGLDTLALLMKLQTEHVTVIWLLIAFGVVAFLWDRKLRPHANFVLGLLVFSFLALSVGLYYRGHYFIMAYPVLAILAGVGVSSLSSLLARFRPRSVLAAIPVLLFVLAFANALYADKTAYFVDSPHEACRRVYKTNPFPEALEVAKYIRAHSTPDSSVAVLGSEPEIYFYAHRHSATGYIYTYPIVEEQQYGSVMQEEMIHEVESARPEFFVYVMMTNSWMSKPPARTKIFDWAAQYTRDHYTLVGVADGGRGGSPDIYRWDQSALNYQPRRSEKILVFHRNQ